VGHAASSIVAFGMVARRLENALGDPLRVLMGTRGRVHKLNVGGGRRLNARDNGAYVHGNVCRRWDMQSTDRARVLLYRAASFLPCSSMGTVDSGARDVAGFRDARS